MSFLFTPAKEKLLRGQLALDTQDLRALLVMSGSTVADEADAATLAAIEVLDECTGAGYSRQALTGTAVSRDDAEGLAILDADDVAWPAGLGPGPRPNAGLIVYRHLTNDGDHIPVAYVDGDPFPFTGSGNPVTIAWSPAGILQLGGEGEGSVAEGPIYDGNKTITGSLTVNNNLVLPTGSALDYRDGWADVKAFGAVGDGVANDTAAIQAAIDSWPNGGPVFLPAGVYRITSTLTLKKLTRLQGAGYNRYFEDDTFDSTRIDAQGIGNTIALQCVDGSRHVVICDLGLHGPGGDITTSTGIYAAFAAEVRIDNVGIRSFGGHINLEYSQGIVISRVFTTGAARAGLYCYQCSAVYVSGSHFANCIGGNIRLSGGTQSVVLDLPILDEGGPGLPGAGNLFIEAAHNVVFRCPLIYLSRDGYSIRIGPTCSNITLSECVITPFSVDRVGLGIIKIDSGATGVRLVNVVTVPNGSPADIEDDGTDTVWINVNGTTKQPVVATANLPAAGVAEDGRILIEDAGTGVGNLIFYVDGARYRVTGTAAATELTLGPAPVTVTAVAPTMSGGAVVPSGLLTDLVAYWTLDEASGDAIDSVGSNDLTDTSTVTTAAGKQGTARQFTGANSEYFTIPDNADLSTGNIDFTIAGWVYLDSLSTARNIVSKTGAGTGEYWLGVYDAPPGRALFQVSADGTTFVGLVGDAVATAGWHFLVAWHDSVANTINVQVDDGTVASAAHTTGVFSSTAAFRMGYDGSWFWDGRIDEIGFWKRVLTATERTNLYASGSGATFPFTGIP